MSHVVKTTIVTSATGEISGYGFCVEAEHNGEPAEIAACITAGLDMLRTTITAAFASTDPPPGYAPAAPPEESRRKEGPAEGQPPAAPVDAGLAPAHAPATPPATPEEAEARFYARYGVIIGGQDWASVRGYLRQPRRPTPTSVEQWIATTKAVQTISQGQQESTAGVAQRRQARH